MSSIFTLMLLTPESKGVLSNLFSTKEITMSHPDPTQDYKPIHPRDLRAEVTAELRETFRSAAPQLHFTKRDLTLDFLGYQTTITVALRYVYLPAFSGAPDEPPHGATVEILSIDAQDRRKPSYSIAPCKVELLPLLHGEFLEALEADILREYGQ